jgi:acyl-coenzyme A thioesterase PaaI-like protein
MPEPESERERLAASIRSLLQATRVTETDTDDMASARALVDQATALLDAGTFEGPHSQMGFGPLLETVDFNAPPSRWYPFSPVIGRCNPLAPPVELDIAEDTIHGITTKVATGTVTLTEAYTGPPWDNTHGGIVSAIFDELLGVAVMAAGRGGYTGRLTVNFRKPTPIRQRLDLRAWVDSADGRKITARGEIRADGVVTADAEGLFIESLTTLTSTD